MPLCQNCQTVISKFYSPLSESYKCSRPYEDRPEEGIARWYCFLGLTDCELCSMMKLEINQAKLDAGCQAVICFNASSSGLKGWIDSEVAFSFSVRVTCIEKDDHNTIKPHGFQYISVPKLSARTPSLRQRNRRLWISQNKNGNKSTISDNEAISTTGHLRDEDMMRVATAQKWIRDCRLLHHECNSWTSGYFPTRLIDVKRVRLIETRQQQGPFHYAALTHCWGSNMPATGMTRILSLSSHLKVLALLQLPNSFRDAILIARTLEIPYIWIDSLCIIQDSPEDWEKESAQMGLIYSNAWCTIAASSVKSCHDGIPVYREDQRCSFDVFLERDQESQEHVNISQTAPNWETFYNTNPLNKRGWTFQERELSPRILHFSAKQMWWECRSLRDQEDPFIEDVTIREPAVNGQLKRVAKIREKMEHIDDYSISTISTGIVENEAIQIRCLDTAPALLKNSVLTQKLILTEARHNMWHKTVQDYSARTFTTITDRFPALSGLASQMQAAYGGEYVAGMWRDDLLRSLLWRRDPEPTSSTQSNETHDRPSEYRAPSWSWAAIDEAISYDLVTLNRPKIDNLRPTTAHIEHVSLNPAGFDPKGRLKGGSMLIRGKLKLI